MNDIRPPKRPEQPQPPASPQSQPEILEKLLEGPESPPLLEEHTTKPKRRRFFWWIGGGLLVALLLAAIAGVGWYSLALKPVDPSAETRTRVKVVAGSSPSQIGELLKEHQLIRSTLAFDLYTRVTGTRSQLKAGTYNLSAAESTQAIVNHLVGGKVDQFTITFLPGATLAENRAVLVKAGYSPEEVDAALSKHYNHPIFADKPSGADLEGYIYGETYQFSSDATVEDILMRTFDEFDQVIQENDLKGGFKKQGLNLYEAITLASIIQREVALPEDQGQVAQVFYKRLNEDIPLGADATFVYAAKKLGLTPTVDLNSPYNTRVHKGLPPGPISSPGQTALEAVAKPVSGNYLYFVSGDDGTTHFSHTEAEHEAKTRQYCKENCSLF